MSLVQRLWHRAFDTPDPPPRDDTIADVLRRKAELMPDHVALLANGRAPLSYREWRDRADALAAQLIRATGGKPATFALLFDGQDWLNYAIAYVAVAAAGGTALHLHGRLGTAETARRLRECGAAWILSSRYLDIPPGYAPVEAMAVATLSAARPSLPHPIAPDPRIAEIRYTSGTTGAAKGYRVPHANLQFTRTLAGLKGLEQSRSLLAPIWLADSSSATTLTIAVTSSNRLVTCLPCDIERMGELIEELAIESVLLTPNVARQLAGSRLDERHDLGSVRQLAFSSSPLVPPILAELARMFPAAGIQVACAQSEASPALLTGVHDPALPFGIGRPTPDTEARVVGQDGDDAPDDSVGELWLRTHAAKRLFVSDPERNAAIARDGWYRTGDLVIRRRDGRFEFFDRKVDAIARDGALISSVYVEAAITAHPAVLEVAAVSPADCRVGNIVAFIVPREATAPNTLSSELERIIPAEWLPERIILVPELPRTMTGKIIKRDLRISISGR